MFQAQQREAPSLTRDDPAPGSPACDPASMSTDGYGAQVSVRDGIPSFTLVGHTDGEQQMIAELLQRSLAGLWPRRRITVVVPPDWSPNHETIMSLAQAIHSGARPNSRQSRLGNALTATADATTASSTPHGRLLIKPAKGKRQMPDNSNTTNDSAAPMRRDRQPREIRAKSPHSNPALDAIDIALIAERMDAIDSHDGPLEGDYVVFADGVERRISHHWTDGTGWDGGCQTSDGGRFHLISCGCSFSGSLYPCVPTDSLTLTDEYRDGEAWIFHHDRQAGGNGVEFVTGFRVYRSSENAPR